MYTQSSKKNWNTRLVAHNEAVENSDSERRKYKACAAGIAVRLFLILWGHYQDKFLSVKYTDVDYVVFSDASRYVTQGQSPYLRPTYRYTPLLAWILTPNIFLHSDFGKLLFSIVDLINGLIIYGNVRSRFSSPIAFKSLCLWLFNPITLVVSTRGSAESLIVLTVLMTLYFHHRCSYLASGFSLGLAVHLKLYPVIYSLVFYTSISPSVTLFQSLKPNLGRVKLVVGFCLSLVMASSVSYYFYGWPFLHETYLYHLTRQDVRHNFSPYFYLLYLHGELDTATLVALASFLPQVLIVLVISWRYRSRADIGVGLFVLTFGFVTFNKVVTSQYFLWYLSLLPLCLPELNFSNTKRIAMASAWLLSQGLWLLSAYRLEFLGHNVMLHVWMASLLFFAVNIYIMTQVLQVKRSRGVKKLL
ncbi:GPI mannosyltransferase 1 [Daphnia magna]|uniref:GPI alpha-1,4-mannosyltransferase I, catalytic subunit n=2 Tax=Daphnia magna TaxID=35525 RepID=A0A0N8EED7_9CRUS|nr:GPI mannosyltransferase 1 [Daphnia magna]